MSLVAALITRYGAFVQRRPLLAQIATAGVIVTIGDVLAQKLVERKPKYDYRRTLVMGACGAGYFGPLVGTWLRVLDKFTYPLLVKVFADQFVFTPVLLTGFFFVQSILMGRGTTEASRKVRNDMFTVLKINWAVWIPVQLVNFHYVPFKYRMLVIQIVALFWNTYISVKANRTLGDHSRETI